MVSFRRNCKYPAEYVLADKVKTDDLNCLLSRMLDLCAEHNINAILNLWNYLDIHLDIMDKSGYSFEEINGVSHMMATIINFILFQIRHAC